MDPVHWWIGVFLEHASTSLESLKVRHCVLGGGGGTPDAAVVMPALWRDCHALSAAASVAFLAVEATLPAEAYAFAPRRAKREAEARAVALARRVYGDDAGLAILCDSLLASWAGHLARNYLSDPAEASGVGGHPQGL